MSKLLDLLKSAGGEAQLASRLGKWRLAASILADAASAAITALVSDVTAVEGDVGVLQADVNTLEATVSVLSGGGMLPATGTTTGARPLDGYDTTLLEDGSTVFVEGGINEWYYFSVASALVADGLNVVDGVGPGQFLRMSTVLIQTAWVVDSAAGDDENPGTAAAPLATLAELGRRVSYRTVYQATTVELLGDFPNETLTLTLNIPAAVTFDIFGSPSAALAAGTLTAYQQSNSTLRGSITDAAGDFTGFERKRVRITDGASTGAVTWIGSLAAATQANTGQFVLAGTSSLAVNNPAVGSAYVVEDLATQIQDYNFIVQGGGTLKLSHVKIGSSLVGHSSRPQATCTSLRVRIFGCEFYASTGTILFQGTHNLGACSSRSGFFTLRGGEYTITGHCHFDTFSISSGANVLASRALHDGNGTSDVRAFFGNGSYIEDTGDRGIFGSASGANPLVTVEDFGQWVISASGGNTFWGTGNVAGSALRVRNGCGVGYVTKPTATGSAPGTDVILAGAAAIAWAAVPALAASPDNAFVNVRQ